MLAIFSVIGDEIGSCGCNAYSTERLAEGTDEVEDLLAMLRSGGGDVKFSAAPASVDLQDLSHDATHDVGGDDTTMYARTSLQTFLTLLLGVKITAVHKKSLRAGGRDGRDHVVVTGPEGFCLCSCLHLLRTGRLCRHILAGLVDLSGTATWEFDPTCLHPRWRAGGRPWSTEAIAKKTVETEDVAGGVPEQDVAAQQELVAKKASAVKQTIFADWVATGKECGQEAFAAGLSLQANQRLMTQVKAMFDISLKAERATATTQGSVSNVIFSGTRQAEDGDATARGSATGGGRGGGRSRGRGGRGRASRGRAAALGGRGRGEANATATGGRGGANDGGDGMGVDGRGGGVSEPLAIGGRGRDVDDGTRVGGRGGGARQAGVAGGIGPDVNEGTGVGGRGGGARETRGAGGMGLRPGLSAAAAAGVHLSSPCSNMQRHAVEDPSVLNRPWHQPSPLQPRTANVGAWGGQGADPATLAQRASLLLD